MIEQPKMKNEGKNSIKKVFDSFKKPNNETKLSLDYIDPTFAGRKLLRWVVICSNIAWSICFMLHHSCCNRLACAFGAHAC